MLDRPYTRCAVLCCSTPACCDMSNLSLVLSLLRLSTHPTAQESTCSAAVVAAQKVPPHTHTHKQVAALGLVWCGVLYRHHIVYFCCAVPSLYCAVLCYPSVVAALITQTLSVPASKTARDKSVLQETLAALSCAVPRCLTLCCAVPCRAMLYRGAPCWNPKHAV